LIVDRYLTPGVVNARHDAVPDAVVLVQKMRLSFPVLEYRLFPAGLKNDARENVILLKFLFLAGKGVLFVDLLLRFFSFRFRFL
jgi:hypothetical protein